MLNGTQAAVAPEVDQALPETQTEEPEELTLPEVAAGEPVEAAADDGEKPLTRAEVEKLLADREVSIRQQAVEEARDLERRQRQSEEGRRAYEQERRVKQRDAVSISLTRKLGITDIDDDVADDIISRVQSVEQDAIESGTASAIDEAITAAAARAVGLNPGVVSAQAERYVPKFQGYMERLLTHPTVREFILRDAKKDWEAQLPAVVEAEISKRKPTQPELKRPEGAPGATDNSDQERQRRLAFGAPTPDDHEWLRQKYPG